VLTVSASSFDVESQTVAAAEERLAALGYDVVASRPEEFATRIKVEIDMWAKVIRAANIKTE
jgi:tripartite-type tricarboxylate transporter receptor subunit TctC